MSEPIKIGRIDPRDVDSLSRYVDPEEARFYCAWCAAESGDYHAATAHLHALTSIWLLSSKIPPVNFVKTGDRKSDWLANFEAVTNTYFDGCPDPEPFDRSPMPKSLRLQKHWMLAALQEEFPSLEWSDGGRGKYVYGYLPSSAWRWLAGDPQYKQSPLSDRDYRCAIKVESEGFELSAEFFGVRLDYFVDFDDVLAWLRDMAKSVSVKTGS